MPSPATLPATTQALIAHWLAAGTTVLHVGGATGHRPLPDLLDCIAQGRLAVAPGKTRVVVHGAAGDEEIGALLGWCETMVDEEGKPRVSLLLTD